MSDQARVVHYINQFFGQVGGEDKAGMPMEVKDGPVGPGAVLEQDFGGKAKVVGTIIAGDNWLAGNLEENTAKVVEKVAEFKPDIFVAGPAFNAGRYGVACGSVCKAVAEKLNIPVVTGMYVENPGVNIYKRYVYIVKTENHARDMPNALQKMAALALKQYNNEYIGGPEEDGFHKRGIMRCVRMAKRSSTRLIDMALDRWNGRPYQTEIPMKVEAAINFAAPVADLSKATIAVVTDGGLYPEGNPDRMPPMNTDRFMPYSFAGQAELKGGDWMVNHPGYDSVFVVQDPNRLIPVDALRELEKEGFIGKLHESFVSTSGLVGSEENSKRAGQGISKYLKDHNVDAVVLTST